MNLALIGSILSMYQKPQNTLARSVAAKNQELHKRIEELQAQVGPVCQGRGKGQGAGEGQRNEGTRSNWNE